MDNPTIQTDLAQVLNKLDSKIEKLSENIDHKLDKISDRLNKLETGQAEIKGSIETVEQKLSGQIKALDTKTEQLNIRVGNVEIAVRGVLIGLAIVVLGGFAMYFWMSNKL